MSTDGGGWSSVTSLLGSPATRTAAVAVCASAVALAFSLQSRKPPKVPDKDGDAANYRPSRSRVSSSSSTSSSLAESKNSVAIFWDVDNCSPPTGASGHSVAQSIRRAAQGFAKEITKAENNISIVSFKAYLELTTEGSQPSAARVQLHSELQGSGVSLIDTPKSGRKDVADKMMITDLLSFAIDKRPPALIVLLSGDRDFAYPLGILRNRGYEILLVVPPVGATPILEASANHVMKWRQDVLGLERDGHGRLYNKVAGKQFDSSTSGRVIASSSIKENGATSNFTSAPISKERAASAKEGDPISKTIEGEKGRMNKANTTFVSESVSQTTAMSALKGPGAPPVPYIFQSLVRVLEQMRKEGYTRPLRSMCAMRLLSLDRNVYEKAGATSWGDYTAVAEAAGIVTLGGGGKPGTEWIALRTIVEEANKAIPQDEIQKEKAPNAAVMDDVSIFYPLIEVHKSIRSSLSKTELPTVTQMAAHLTRMWEIGLRDTYTQAGVTNFGEYIALAEQAKVARLVKAEGYGENVVVQIHPKYANIHTSIITPSSSEARMIDTTKVVGPSPSSGFAGMLPFTKKGKEAKESKDTKGAQAELIPTSMTPKSNEKNTLLLVHQPSGEKIHISYFPLANLLLTQRAEGKITSSDSFVHSVLIKHPKVSHYISTPEQFSSYLSRAERDNIIICHSKGGKRFVSLEPRLCKGEEDHDWKRLHGDAGMKRGESASSSTDRPSSPEKAQRETPVLDESTSERTPSPSFNTEPASSQDRAKFKPLVEVLVGMRKELPEGNEEPSRAKVSQALRSRPVDGEILSPGAWIQSQGYTGFAEYYQVAQRKGFVHLIKSGADGKESIRLSEKYEKMFFPAAK